MSILINTTYRSELPEIMDDLAMEGKQLRNTLDKIAQINRWLGGNSLTINGIKKLTAAIPPSREIRIIDAGCGNGDMLRDISNYAKRSHLNFKLAGIDANADTVKHAQDLSGGYGNISYRCENIFDPAFEKNHCDIIICTLTLHHFSDEEILELLEKFRRQAKIGIVINDLQRSALAYRLFQLVCWVFGLDKMPKNDGLISILRGFKRTELRNFSKKLNLKKYSIHWKWAFRYQWIISNL
jgi:2-polyprenyl-3-methyl-5-hydroxy-6-metoxy-1,4-benzoquinol methylase